MGNANIAYRFEDVPADDGACFLEDDAPLVPPGEYEVAFDSWETVALFGGKAKKLVLWFVVLDAGHQGVRLPRYYNVRKLHGKPRKRGRFLVGKKSAFARDYCTLHGTPARADRVCVSKFANQRYRVKVRTVSKGADQREIPDAVRYSVIDQFVRVEK